MLKWTGIRKKDFALNIWFMIWVFVAVFILGTSLWSYYILLKQKRAWGQFSQKHQVEFVPVAFLKSPYIRGMFRGFSIGVYSDKQISGNERQRGIRTVFEIFLKAPMPTEGVVSSGSFRNFVNGLALPDVYTPEVAEWNKDIIIKVVDTEAITAYLTKERLVALNALMSIKNSPAMLLFSNEQTLLRIESSDPFDHADRLERFLTKLTDAAKVISI